MTKINQIGVHPIYRDKKLVAIVTRDDVSKKHITYLTEEASSEDIAELMEQESSGGGAGNYITNANPLNDTTLHI